MRRVRNAPCWTFAGSQVCTRGMLAFARLRSLTIAPQWEHRALNLELPSTWSGALKCGGALNVERRARCGAARSMWSTARSTWSGVLNVEALPMWRRSQMWRRAQCGAALNVEPRSMRDARPVWGHAQMWRRAQCGTVRVNKRWLDTAPNGTGRRPGWRSRLSN